MSLFNFLSQMAAQSRDAVGRRRTSSVMSPLNTYAGIGTSTCFAAAYAFRDNHVLSAVLVGAGCLVVATVGCIAVYFALKDPDRLHSEEHLTTVRQLDLIAEKGGRIAINPVDLPAITNSPPPTTTAGEPVDEPSNREATDA